MSKNSPITDQEIATVVAILKKLPRGPVPFDIFHELARITVLPTIDLVPLRIHNDRVEVLLTRREVDDPIFPYALHLPGTIMRGNDQLDTFQSAFDRVLRGELGGLRTSKPIFVTNLFKDNGRGAEYRGIYYVECHEEPIIGKFYDVEHLPGDFITGQISSVEAAVVQFLTELEPNSGSSPALNFEAAVL